MLNKIVSLFLGQPSKVKKNVKLSRPSYADRYRERDFLVLASGPSIRQHREKIQEFINRNRPIVMAGNFIDDMFIPDYHAFVNRARFRNYMRYTNPASRVLLSPYFSDSIIKALYKGDYEEIAFENEYPSDTGEIKISDGIIHAKGATIATILIAVAIVMGAGNVYAAGLDGYSTGDSTHHYNEADNKTREELLLHERLMGQQLKCLEEYLKERNGNLTIITRTAYDTYYRPIESFIA